MFKLKEGAEGREPFEFEGGCSRAMLTLIRIRG